MKWKKWVQQFLLGVIVIFALIFLMGEVTLNRLHENYLPKDIADMSLDGRVLYGSAISDNTAAVKLEIVGKKQPSIVAFGSSRVMQFRGTFFKNKDFYTLGGIVPNIDCLEQVYKEVHKVYQPNIIIIGVDMWWLNPNFNDFTQLQKNNTSLIAQKINLYRATIVNLRENKELRDSIFYQEKFKTYDEIAERKNIGALAAVYNEGYREDGSYQYGRVILDSTYAKRQWEKSWVRIVNKTDRFVVADGIAADRLDKLQRIIRRMQDDGSKVVVFLAPFPHKSIEQFMSNEGQRTVITSLRSQVPRICQEEGTPCYDFSDMSDINSPNTESLDGFHGSERTYAKIMLNLFENEAILRPYINEDYIRQELADNEHPFIAINPYE